MIQKIPMRRAAPPALALLFAAYFGSGCSKPTTTMPKITYPQTKRGDVVEKIFDCAIGVGVASAGRENRATEYLHDGHFCWYNQL